MYQLILFMIPIGENDGLAQIWKLRQKLRVTLIISIDLQVRLVNGKVDSVKHISQDSTNSVTKIYIKFDDHDDDNTRLKSMNINNLLSNLYG